MADEGARLRIFPVTPRGQDRAKYLDDIRLVGRFGDSIGFAGMLLFTGNDSLMEPWTAAHYVLANTKSMSPLIAVNPVYMHPFTVAKMISSMAALYNRQIYLNLVTGTAISDLHSLGDQLSHAERYARLGEFIGVVRHLLGSSRPLSLDGKFYKVANLQLRPRFAGNGVPEFVIAGQSDAARRLAREMGCVAMQMLPVDLDEGLGQVPGVNLGILTRADRQQAWDAAHRLFPHDAENQSIHEYTMANTDSVWKRRLDALGNDRDLRANGYWLGPFKGGQADCPYLVGSYEDVATTLRGFVARKIDTIILDVIPDEEELRHIGNTLELSGILERGPAIAALPRDLGFG